MGNPWNHLANERLTPLIGLAPLPVAQMHKKFSEYDVTAGWKWRHAVDYAGSRPFAWIDDGFTVRMLRYAEDRAKRLKVPTLLIQADPAVGLTDAMVREVQEWAHTLPGN